MVNGTEFKPLTEEDLRSVGVSVAERMVLDDNDTLKGHMEHLSWGGIASYLRRFPVDFREQLLVEFFGPKGANFPSGKKIATLLARLSGMELFATASDLSEEPLNLIEQHIVALGVDLQRGNRVQNQGFWNDALDAAFHTVNQTAQENGREVAEIAAFRLARAISEDLIYGLHERIKPKKLTGLESWNVDRFMEGEVAWMTVEDLMPQKGYTRGNLFTPLRRLIEVGWMPRGVTKGQFLIAPPKFSVAEKVA